MTSVAKPVQVEPPWSSTFGTNQSQMKGFAGPREKPSQWTPSPPSLPIAGYLQPAPGPHCCWALAPAHLPFGQGWSSPLFCQLPPGTEHSAHQSPRRLCHGPLSALPQDLPIPRLCGPVTSMVLLYHGCCQTREFWLREVQPGLKTCGPGC